MDAPHDIKYRFNPLSSKSRKVLGPLEGEIMEVVWAQGPCTVSQVHRALRDRKDIAYTTVMTTMSRLAKKHLLEQDRSLSSYVYSPVLSHADFDHYVVKGVILGLFEDYGDTVSKCYAEVVDERDPALFAGPREMVGV